MHRQRQGRLRTAAIVVLAAIAVGHRAYAQPGAPPSELAVDATQQHRPQPAGASKSVGSARQAAARTAETALPLKRPNNAGGSSFSGSGALWRTLGVLSLSIAALLAASWWFKRFAPHQATAIPSEVVEVLGRTSLGLRQQAQVVRFGDKLLLVAVGAAGCDTIAAIDDPAEVRRLTALCLGDNHAASPHQTASQEAFNSVMRRAATDGKKQRSGPDAAASLAAKLAARQGGRHA